MAASKISLTEYGSPPDIPSLDDILEDIGKASLDDIVFKSSRAINKPLDTEENLIRSAEKDDAEIPEDRKALDPNLAYQLSMKLIERQKASMALLKTLDNHENTLNNLKDKITNHLERLNTTCEKSDDISN
eukprot:gene9781-10780_t